MIKFPFVVFALALGGCGLTPQGDFLRSAIADRGSDGARIGLENAVWFLCRAATRGSIQDYFGRTEELADAYNTLCPPDAGDVAVITGAV